MFIFATASEAAKMDMDALNDEEKAAIATAAKRQYERERHPLAPGLAALRSALIKLGLVRLPPPPGPPLPQAPPRARGGKPVRR